MMDNAFDSLNLVVLLSTKLGLVFALAEWFNFVNDFSHAPSDVYEFTSPKLALRIESQGRSRPHFAIWFFCKYSSV